MTHSINLFNNEPKQNNINSFKDEDIGGKLIFFNGILAKIDGYNTRNLKFKQYTRIQKVDISIDITLLTCGEQQTYYKFKNELSKKMEHIALKDIKFNSAIFDYDDEAFNKIFISTTKNNEEQLKELINISDQKHHMEKTILQRDMAGIVRCETMSKRGTNEYYSNILKELSIKFKVNYMNRFSRSKLHEYIECEHQREIILRFKQEWQDDGRDVNFNSFMERQRELQRTRDQAQPAQQVAPVRNAQILEPAQ
jgi:hypothetical protein